ncbi:MAG TPA: autotransporter assembly complex family protein [Desulfuromonadaceae bacterium]
MARLAVLHRATLCILLWLCCPFPVMAAEPVEVIVEGVDGAALKNVREALALPPGLVRGGKVDRLWLEHIEHQAATKVLTALEPFGYYHARVSTSIESAAEGRYRLRVRVTPGVPVHVRSINVAVEGPGAGEAPLKELAAAFPLHKGDILLQQQYEEAKGRLLSRAQELGYLDGAFAVHRICISKSESSADIELVLETGGRYRFGDVRIEGGDGYPDRFLRRYLAFRPGEIFSPAKLGETQVNFTNSERFKEVIVIPEKDKARDLVMPVLVKLAPAPSRSLRPGIGYGTDTGARVGLRYRDLDMFRLGHDLNINLYIAENLQGLSAGYTIPSYRDIRGSTGVQLNLQREDVTTYVSRLASLEVDRNHRFDAGRLGTAYVRLQQEDFTIGAQNAGTRLVLPGLRFTDNHYDNLIRPLKGYRYDVEVRGTTRFMGSDTSLLQVVAQGSTLVPLPWRLSLHTRAKAGATLFSDPLSELPVSLRFFAGGDQSVRGYTYQSLGPRDANGNVVGGKQLLVGSTELERALFQNWGVSLFYDAGNAFNTFDTVYLFQGAGVGVHYYSPIGAINLYLARQIGVPQPAYHIHFTMGFEL